MNLVHHRTLIPNTMQTTEAPVEQMVAISWSPNNQKLAAAGKDKIIYMYDETGEQRDRFQTRPADAKQGINYTISSIAFSPDSAKLAVGQTDGIIYMYKVGNEFKLKKSITNKVMQPFGVLKVLWPNEFELISGLMDGKLRHTPVTSTKGLRSRTFYNPDSQVVALTTNIKSTMIASGHLDGRVTVFSLGETTPIMKYVIQNPLPAFALTFGGSMILAGSCDSKITVYDQGRQKQILDFSQIDQDRDFVVATGSPSGLAAAFGGFDRIRLLRWVPRRKLWEEGRILDIKNLYTVTSMTWNDEGTCVAAGTMLGGLHLFDTVIRKSRTDRYEISYSTPFHAIVTMTRPPASAQLQSMYKLEILEIRILGHYCYAIAHTLETMLICDIYKNLTSEIRWEDVDDNEKFYFDNPNACMIFNAGEMTLVEYGQHKPLGTFRTEFMNPHLTSIRINERLENRDSDTKQNKKLAYLIDLQTVTIVDLVYNTSLGHINHDTKIDWLELNETGTKLLYRDRKLRLCLIDVEKMEKNTIMFMCNFVQWVPESDVIVAQNRNSLCVWYDVDSPADFTDLDVTGLAFEVVRSQRETLILVQDGTIVHQVPLDASRIEFGTAILDGDYLRAMLYLEITEFTGDKETMWKQLAKEAIEAKELKIAERACYASGDIARAKYISTTIRAAERSYIASMNENDIVNELQARISVLNGDLQTAEYLIMDNDNLENAIHLYTTNHKWKEAIRLGSEKHYNNFAGLVRAHLFYLIRTGQVEVAAEFLEDNGNLELAATLFWKIGMHIKAARLIELNYTKMDPDPLLVKGVGQSLTEHYLFGEAAEYYDAVGDMKNACINYKKSNQFEQSVRISKKHFPGTVVALEKEWADYLYSKKIFDLACNHYVEAGKLREALDAAIQGRHWAKAANIIEVIDDPRTVASEYIRIGEYYAAADDTVNAEKCFIKAGNPKKAVDMFMSKGKWEEAFSIGSRIPTVNKELETDLFERANNCQENEIYAEAEKLFIAVGKPDNAITMYGEANQFEDMLRLVTIYHPTHLIPSYQHVAELLKEDENYKGAEIYYIKAGQYKTALNMYLETNLYEDAVRISKAYGTTDSYKVVIYKWAISLGAELGYKLLYRHELLDDCLLYYCDHHLFDYALALGKEMGPDKVTGVLYQQARFAEEQGDLEFAIECYLAADDSTGATHLYLKHQMFDKAIRMAEENCPTELDIIYVTYGRYLFDMESYSKFESVLLRADKADMIIQSYQDKGMWKDAFRICEDYSPNMMNDLQEAYDTSEAELNPGSNLKDSTRLINKAQEYEKFGQNDKAIDCYVKLNKNNMKDQKLLGVYWKRAAELAMKFLSEQEAHQILGVICPNLTTIGHYNEAAFICFEAGLTKQGLEFLLSGGLYEEATRVALDMGEETQEYVKTRRTNALKESGSVEELTTVNLEAALEVLKENEDWEKLLETAKANPDLFSIYIGKYAVSAMSDKDPLKALKIYHTNGVPTTHSHLSIFQGLVLAYFSEPMLDLYENNVILRDTLFRYITVLSGNTEVNMEQLADLDHLLFIVHLYTNRSIFRTVPGFEFICTKISISLLRYGDILPVERSFFDAGISCKDIRWNDLALIFLNHYLDVFDAVEEGKPNTNDLDSSTLKHTDIPLFCTLLSHHLVSQEEHEEAKDWVLSASMDRNIAEDVRHDSHAEYEPSLSRGGTVYHACIISGYPVINNAVQFEGDRYANKDDWNKFMMTIKAGGHQELVEIQKFLGAWCITNLNYNI